MNVGQYLKRINYKGPVAPTFYVLKNLQQAHLLSVPFENIYIQNKILIELKSSYDKIVIQNRGGFCYELNSLFYDLLKNIGFKVKMISARVYDIEKGYGPEFDHLALIAEIENDNYLVDVGFGEFSLHPLKIELNKELIDPRGVFLIESSRNYYSVKKRNSDGKFIPEYLFSDQERQLYEFNEMLLYHQTSPDSHFTQKLICSLPTNNGRITLTGNILKITEKNNNIHELKLKDNEEINQVLKDYFKIEVLSE